MDLIRAMKCSGGVASRQSLMGRGITDGQIRQALRDGIVSNVQRGIFQLPEADPLFLQAHALKGVLTCVSAAPYYQLWCLHGHAELHLSCRNGLPRPSAVTHRKLLLPPNRIQPIAALADVLLDALHCLPRFEALAMVQCAVGRGDINKAFLRGHLAGNRNGGARAVLDLVGRRADSLLEPIARVLFREAGFWTECYVRIDGVGEVDFLLEGYLVVEIDGGTHFEPRSIKKDRRRDNMAVVGGYLVLRYFYDDVVHHPQRMTAEVAAVLQRGRGWRP
ncbi:DUF559 domain-containing protein [Paenarthrobacter sp. Z7-10]|uniref:endonuclease domain-containing protein n=1 Tax=Paenarthrobacter sp. Z7-10 TaxID=2787635 RepID=UPI0022A9561C|nr:DUF559 domain-containing protein [Paenarthrobacter sp. Z7-10]MCZ2402297.1 DUF559 domain-containing protein [Paenarthrobacter sp. Z7-10]